jgi:hypothetical protein
LSAKVFRLDVKFNQMQVYYWIGILQEAAELIRKEFELRHPISIQMKCLFPFYDAQEVPKYQLFRSKQVEQAPRDEVQALHVAHLWHMMSYGS